MATGIAGKTVLVTGSAGEPERAFALAFVREGAGHVILVDINEAGLAESKALIEAEGAAAFTYRVDLSVEAEIVALGEAVVAAHLRLDVLIHNAGLHMGEIARGFAGLGLAKWQYFFAINTFAPLLLDEAVRPSLKAAKSLIVPRDGGNAMRGFACEHPRFRRPEIRGLAGDLQRQGAL